MGGVAEVDVVVKAGELLGEVVEVGASQTDEGTFLRRDIVGAQHPNLASGSDAKDG